MSTLTQGTQVYCLAPTKANPAVFEVFEIEDATAFTPGGNPKDQIDVTSLSETEARKYKKGLGTPASASLTVNADSQKASHVRLWELHESSTDENLKFTIGWSDGSDVTPSIINSGRVVSINVTAHGSGYVTAPAVSISGGGGSGATGQAVIDAGEVVGILITNRGNGYTSTPTVTLSGGSGTGATATVIIAQAPDFSLPNSRTWFTFEGYISDFPFDFQANALVSTAVTIQRSGKGNWTQKSA